MTFSGNFMPKRFGAGKPQKPKIKRHREKQQSVGRMPKWQEEAFAGLPEKDQPK